MTGETDCHDQNDAADRDRSNPHLYRLRPLKIEEEFFKVILDLRQVVVLDGVDMFDDPPAFRIRSHDLYGLLPAIDIRDSEDRWPVLDSIQMETARLCAVVQIRDNLAGIFPGCKFLPPTKTDNGVLVGLRFAGRIMLTEGQSYCETYHKLTRKAVRRIL